MDQVHQLENEIIANCVECNAERLLAYWDEELECYIYLCDEEPLCNECMSKHDTIPLANNVLAATSA
jgi:hypothetical protein